MLKMVNLSCLQGIHKHTKLFTRFIFRPQELIYSVQWTAEDKIPCYLPAKTAAEAIKFISFELHSANFPHLTEKLILKKMW